MKFSPLFPEGESYMKEYKNKCDICGSEFNIDELTNVSMKRLCNSCLNRIWEIENNKRQLEYQKKNNTMRLNFEKLYPKDIKRKLDEYIIGQENAKKILSVAVYNHYKRIQINDPDVQKSNILLIGPSGSGKTHLIRTLAKILNVPIAVTPATSLTEEGYVGASVSSTIENLYIAAGKDVERTEQGIVFIDEIDKLARPNSSRQQDVGGPGVQQALLTILEGSKVTVGNKYTMFRDSVEIDTTNILFICGGAFPEIENIIKERINKTTNQLISPLENQLDASLKVTTEDLLKFGLIPEFLGRLPIIVSFERLYADLLKKILTIPKDSIISQYQRLFNYDNIKLTFEEDALDVIAEKAFLLNTGARSLRTILEDVLLEIMYVAPSDANCHEIIINRACAEGTGSPYYITK